MSAKVFGASGYDWLGIPARVMMSLLFLISGYGKLANVSAIQAYMQNFGVPPILSWPAAAWELTAGLALILGLWTKPLALLLAGWCLLTAAIFHTALSDPNQLMNFLKNVTMAGSFLTFAAFGVPGWTLEARSALLRARA